MATEIFHIKKGDTLPPIKAILKDATKNPVDLTEADRVEFHMRLQDGGTLVVDEIGDILDASQGLVQYAWAEGDTDISGRYDAEFEVFFGTRNESFPNNSHVLVIIFKEIG